MERDYKCSNRNVCYMHSDCTIYLNGKVVDKNIKKKTDNSESKVFYPPHHVCPFEGNFDFCVVPVTVEGHYLGGYSSYNSFKETKYIKCTFKTREGLEAFKNEILNMEEYP